MSNNVKYEEFAKSYFEANNKNKLNEQSMQNFNKLNHITDYLQHVSILYFITYLLLFRLLLNIILVIQSYLNIVSVLIKHITF